MSGSVPVLGRRTTRIRPGVIVSTIVEPHRAQTITVTRDASAPIGARLLVERDVPPEAARVSHLRAVVLARNPGWARTLAPTDRTLTAVLKRDLLTAGMLSTAEAERILRGVLGVSS